MLSTRCICLICNQLLNMRQLYGMAALNRTHKHLKIQNEAAGFVTGLTRSISLENMYVWLGNSITKKAAT